MSNPIQKIHIKRELNFSGFWFDSSNYSFLATLQYFIAKTQWTAVAQDCEIPEKIDVTTKYFCIVAFSAVVILEPENKIYAHL
jgi:hypothetical protein